MIQRLRKKFIAASMLAVFLVVGAILGILNVISYRNIVSDADDVLALLRDNDGALPEALNDFDWRAAPPRYQSPELAYELRFFSVLVDAQGNLLQTDTDRIFAVDTQGAEEYLNQALQTGNDSGFVGDFRYLRYAEDGATRVIFLDCGRLLAGFQDVLLNGVGIALAGFGAVFLLLLLFSGRILRPFARNYEAQRRFVTNAGHEIKTPVTIIDADAELLEMEGGQSEWLRDIRRQTQRLTVLTNDLVTLSRMEEHDGLQMLEFPLSDAMQEVADSFQAPARKLGKALCTRIQPGLSFRGDERSLRQLAGILLDNALKYSIPGGEVDMRLLKQGRRIRMSVSNRAEGLRASDLNNLFERFYRADPSRAAGGHGIGLSIARAVAEAHRGRIAASLRDGDRLTITVALPL